MQTQSFKTTPQFQFGLRLIANQRGEAQSTVIEGVIKRMADELKLSRHWIDLWDEEESVRMLNCFALPEYRAKNDPLHKKHPAPTEAQLRAFVIAHAQFFYADKARTTPKRKYAVILWPHIEELTTTWMEKRDEDYHVAAKQMATLLKKAKLDPPEFG